MFVDLEYLLTMPSLKNLILSNSILPSFLYIYSFESPIPILSDSLNNVLPSEDIPLTLTSAETITPLLLSIFIIGAI